MLLQFTYPALSIYIYIYIIIWLLLLIYSQLKRKCGWLFSSHIRHPTKQLEKSKCFNCFSNKVRICIVKEFFYIAPEIRIRVRRVVGIRFGSVEKRHQNYKLWTTDHPTSRHVSSSWGGRAFSWLSAFKDSHSHI